MTVFCLLVLCVCGLTKLQATYRMFAVLCLVRYIYSRAKFGGGLMVCLLFFIVSCTHLPSLHCSEPSCISRAPETWLLVLKAQTELQHQCKGGVMQRLEHCRVLVVMLLLACCVNSAWLSPSALMISLTWQKPGRSTPHGLMDAS